LVYGKTLGRYYGYYKGEPSTKSLFAALLLTKNYVKIRIRTDPDTFKDPEKWTGDQVYKGYFFKQNQEKGFKLSDEKQFDYAIDLIIQSFELAK
jgi:hypothetical protein